MSEWEKVGEVGVDAGLMWLGDPCYIMGDDATYRVHNWDNFCARLNLNKQTNQLKAGVCVSTGYGDGVYPVEVKRRDGRIAEVRIVFIEEGE